MQLYKFTSHARNQFHSYILFTLLFFLGSSSVYAVSNFWPTREEWSQSFREAARSPATWLPLAGAAVIALTKTDKCISKWAIENTPVYGSNKNAGNQSTNLEEALGVIALGTFLLMPQRDVDKSWLVEKGEYFLVLITAYGAAVGLTGTIKVITQRTRPNKMDNRSFPSGHETSAFAWTAIASRNVAAFNVSPTTQIVANSIFYTMAIGVGIGRVEAAAHWPTDVLVGAAVGNFITSGIYNAFMNKPKSDRLQVSVVPLNKGLYVSIDKDFD